MRSHHVGWPPLDPEGTLNVIYMAMALAGALLCNSLPHLISGLHGKRFFTPWARPRGVGQSSAVENFLWGSANLLVSAFILTRTASENVPHGLMAAAAGFVGAGFGLSILFSGWQDRRK